MLVTVDNDYISLADIVKIRRAPFADLDGLIQVLKDPSKFSAGAVLWVKVDDEIHVIMLADVFNLTSLGVDQRGYVEFNDPSVDQMAEHVLVDAWYKITGINEKGEKK